MLSGLVVVLPLAVWSGIPPELDAAVGTWLLVAGHGSHRPTARPA